jgi:hypothetical protein
MKVHELIAPGVCAICEMANEVEYFDTKFNMHTEPAITRMEGRKYLCHNCFVQAAEHWGYEAENQREAAEEAIRLAKQEAYELRRWLTTGIERVDTVDRKLGESIRRPTGRPRKNADEG